VHSLRRLSIALQRGNARIHALSSAFHRCPAAFAPRPGAGSPPPSVPVNALAVRAALAAAPPLPPRDAVLALAALAPPPACAAPSVPAAAAGAPPQQHPVPIVHRAALVRPRAQVALVAQPVSIALAPPPSARAAAAASSAAPPSSSVTVQLRGRDLPDLRHPDRRHLPPPLVSPPPLVRSAAHASQLQQQPYRCHTRGGQPIPRQVWRAAPPAAAHAPVPATSSSIPSLYGMRRQPSSATRAFLARLARTRAAAAARAQVRPRE
jgi:hypothetical protein